MARIDVQNCHFHLLADLKVQASQLAAPAAGDDVLAGLDAMSRRYEDTLGPLSLLTAAILYMRALAAPRRPYRRTETWLLLDCPRHLPDAMAQRLIGAALGRVLERYARWCAATALIFWLASLAWGRLLGA